MQRQKTGVILLEHIVDVFGSLLRHRHIFGATRNELDNLVARRKHPHQRWHDGLNRVAHIHADNLAATLFLITIRLAAIIFGRLRANRRNGVVDEVLGVVNFLANDALQLIIRHIVGIYERLHFVGDVVDFRVHAILPISVPCSPTPCAGP